MPSATPLATAGKNLILTNLVCKAFHFLCGLQTLLHTHTRIILPPTSLLQRLQITFHGRRAVLGTRPAERQTHRTSFQAEGNTRQRGRAGNQEPTYGGHHDRRSLTEHGMCKIFVPSRRAGHTARGAQQPEAWEKPFPTFASSNTIRSPPRVQTSLQRGFQCLR